MLNIKYATAWTYYDKTMSMNVTFILEGEYRLSLGMLMHVKCIHDLCILPLGIPPYLHHILVIFMLFMIIGNNSHVP
jgi:hypothetical protein